MNIVPKYHVLVALYHRDSIERSVREIYLALWTPVIYVPLKVLTGVPCMSERTGVYRVLVVRGNLRERDYLGDPVIDGRIILRWILREWDVGA